MTLIKDPSFYRRIVRIAVPIALQNLVTFATSMMDSIMLGRADETGLLFSAASLANQPFFILSMLCFGLSGGAIAGIVIAVIAVIAVVAVVLKKRASKNEK